MGVVFVNKVGHHNVILVGRLGFSIYSTARMSTSEQYVLSQSTRAPIEIWLNNVRASALQTKSVPSWHAFSSPFMFVFLVVYATVIARAGCVDPIASL